MRKSNFKQSLWVAIAAMLVSGTASAAGVNIANGKTIFHEGKGDAQACLTCHGENAQGMDAMASPRLANIGYGYIVKQLSDFADDKRIGSGMGIVMNTFAKALSEQDRRDVAAYVSSIKAEPELSNLQELKDSGQIIGESYKGAHIVQAGKGKIPACTSCHDYNGRGVDPIFPKIGQQKYVYLVNQLFSLRDGSRANDPAAMMRVVAKEMTDEDIYDVATYLSSAPPTRGAGDRGPNNDTLLHAVSKHK